MWRSIGHCWVQAAELSMVMLAAPEKQALKLAAAAEMNDIYRAMEQDTRYTYDS